jgi:hypothetical protein
LPIADGAFAGRPSMNSDDVRYEMPANIAWQLTSGEFVVARLRA